MRLSIGIGLGVVLLGSSVLGYEVKTPPLDTDWTYKVGTDPWPEYPRPLLQRSRWQSLNGVWKWRPASGLDEARMAPLNETLTQDVLVPSCLESGLSGVQELNVTYAWFDREFQVPRGWSAHNQRFIINFEAVDYEATVFINGRKAGFHRGGYWHFSVDATEFVNFKGTNKLLESPVQVFVFDPTDMEGYNIPHGKQVRNPSHIFYRPCTGIWQTVWMESVPTSFITRLDIAAGMDGQVDMTVLSSGASESVSVSVLDDSGNVVASHDATSNEPFSFVVDSPQLWSPDSPTLYNLTVSMGGDEVTSYTGFRTISSGEVNGVLRPLLNGKFLFQFGTLDQGFWPDGLYTPPNREAMVYDLKVLKDLGANMLRKHIKVENALFYQACDQMGLLLIQDMPSMKDDSVKYVPTDAEQAEFERQFELLINQHKSYPSIATWIVYNEGWGQYRDGRTPEIGLTARAKELDPTRLVDSTSGWYDHGAGDWHDNHHYANPQCGSKFYSAIEQLNSSPYDPSRIAIQGEFGGIGHNISEQHLWKVQAAINTINQTYEINEDLDAYNYRGHLLMSELLDQVKMYSCSGAVWTQTTDVEGEVNGFLTYDRRFLRLDKKQWKADIQALYDAAHARGGYAMTEMF
ncbi:glycoside hydrolase superfamily [Pseudomassariella vexata]|uniref:Glycoside hydrolase superfamily n=1 Tax=Pseudomassariella vexata TaxID=1141098 RepID=A0A1Y2E0U9_9PEZI|nr:glycoside hydrolase superfamily [Pseudomassariella vexata]ORY65107.1 glycoside hydrolase superfamily [Pseudomassariella vexata]